MRKINDAYYTHKKIVSVLLNNVPIKGTILEPCAGDGKIVEVLQNEGLEVNPNDLADGGWDAADSSAWNQVVNHDWVITNPPFNNAAQILPLAFDHASVGVTFLLRLSYLEPTRNRAVWLQQHCDHLRHLIILGQPRPSFTDNRATDTCTVAWFVWCKNFSWIKTGHKCPFVFSPNWLAD